ncbi:MAG: deoxyribodipyrimidine photo-lyase [Endozoicomonas sp. (ex Botrylloides leachii)]|nr:deoxyribodipyrimidine photo-lyase [Endozoicomonas sp. (ex Botrylloides leachii)]
MNERIAIHWFRQDLRLSDNPALTKAAMHDAVLPIYILDDDNAGKHAMGAASRWWLYHSLQALDTSLGNKLSVYRGNPQTILDDILKHFNVEVVYWNRCYEPWRIQRDTLIKKNLKTRGIAVHTFNGSLLWEPWDIKKNDGTPYKVFTPFYRKGCFNAKAPMAPLAKPDYINYVDDPDHAGIGALNLLPKTSWDKQLEPHWDIGEEGARKRFKAFIEEGLAFYKDGRNLPAKPYVSRLSPYLHYGEISPNQLWHTVRSIDDDKNIGHFCSELGWREFSYSQLYHNPELPHKNLQSKFDAFPWNENTDHLHAWQTGKTGIPMVDAGMRELWQTGYMHNRIRMIVGSFLVKNLRLQWHHGERWFWDTLIDADLANNSASWQWIAGCGADAAPYFRIFNPVTQGQKFDPDGEYVRQYIPEIARLPNKYLFNPWEAPELILKEAGIELGSTYPSPVVNLKQSRQFALQAFQSLKQGGL